MIRLFIMIGVVGTVGLSYFVTMGQGPEYQMSQPNSLLAKFQADGLVPGANELSENDEVEHDIFEVPPEDEVQLKKAMSNPMGGMKMEGMNMPAGTDSKTTMKMEGEAEKKMPMATDSKTTMKMEGEAEKKMPMAADSKTTMKMDEDKDPEHGKNEDKDPEHGEDAEGGLKISEGGAFDREINLTMAEWKFSDMKIDVKSGEKIRFNITNDGKIPHEFMFMTMPAMAAVNYRARRADWNLLEHEALYEKSLVLPGGKFSFVAEIRENGAWMFMCMLPYHMQMGMMGQMATPGMAMDMKM